MGVQSGAATVKNSMEFPQKTKNRTVFDPAIPPLGLYSKNPETSIQKNLCTPMFIAAQFTIVKYPSVNELIKKLWHIYAMEYYAAERRSSYPLRMHGWN